MSSRTRRVSLTPTPNFFAALVVLAAGCGSETAAQPPNTAHARILAEEPELVPERPVDTEGEIGGLDGDGYDGAFKALWPKIASCLEDGASRLDVLGGSFKVVMRIDRRGAPKWAYLSESTLGDRETERCVLDIVKARQWPKPLSGDGIAEKTFSIDAAVAPTELSASEVSRMVKKARAAARDCKRGIKGRFTATAYLDASGDVLSAGVAPPNERGEDVADCVADAVRGVRLGKPLSEPGKVVFALD